MIENDHQLTVTLDQLGRMLRVLASLRAGRDKEHPSWYAIFAEGPLEEIRRMEADISAYVGRTEAEQAEADLWVKVEGDQARWPEAPSSLLGELLGTLRKGVAAAAEWMLTGGLSTRPTAALVRATDLQVAVFRPGSVQVGLRLPAPEMGEGALPGELPERALGCYLAVAEWASSTVEEQALEARVPDAGLRRVLLAEVKRLAPRPRGSVRSVTLSGRGLPGRAAALTRDVHVRIDRAIDRHVAEQVETFMGDLREIDLDQRSFVLRNLSDSPVEVPCQFDDELLDTAKSALDRRVEVHGVRRVAGGRGDRAGRLHVTRLVVLDGGEA